MGISANEYQRKAMEKEADQGELWTYQYALGEKATRLSNAARGLADDAGEVNGAIKRWLEYRQPLDETNLLEEIGDCLWRLAQLCTGIGYTLEEAMEANLRKLNVRYGDGICTPEKAAEESRDRDAERMAVERGEFLAPMSGTRLVDFGNPRVPDPCPEDPVTYSPGDGEPLEVSEKGAGTSPSRSPKPNLLAAPLPIYKGRVCPVCGTPISDEVVRTMVAHGVIGRCSNCVSRLRARAIRTPGGEMSIELYSEGK